MRLLSFKLLIHALFRNAINFAALIAYQYAKQIFTKAHIHTHTQAHPTHTHAYTNRVSPAGVAQKFVCLLIEASQKLT